jgi:alcohol dehydrogenase class IV
MARSLVVPTGLPYGRLVGILLPHLVEFDRPAARERVELLSTCVAREDGGVRPLLSSQLSPLFATLGFPGTLRGAGVERARVEAAREAIVAHALRSPATLANPRVPSAADLGALLDKVMGF